MVLAYLFVTERNDVILKKKDFWMLNWGSLAELAFFLIVTYLLALHNPNHSRTFPPSLLIAHATLRKMEGEGRTENSVGRAETGLLPVVFISGFMSPANWLSYPQDMVPANWLMLRVSPSPTGSLHDRVCEVFYELVGGTTDYGSEHANYHKHDRFGRKYEKGKYPKWSAQNPITVIGHSLGGNTAWLLQNYLALGRFPGYATDASWIAGIVCVNSPLNGALQVYGKGEDLCNAPIVRWGSVGCVIGWIVQWEGFFELTALRQYMDFQQGAVLPDPLALTPTSFAK
jgi:pimeloyl-ACP methyl ester carboxylesterase